VFGALAIKCYKHAPYLSVLLLQARILMNFEKQRTVPRYGLHDRGIVLRFPAREEICLLVRFKTGFGVHRAVINWVYEGIPWGQSGWEEKLTRRQRTDIG
jgi:hypothetical protein